MQILNYFSRDEKKRAKFIFDLVAPLYDRLAFLVEETFESSMEKIKLETTIKGKKVLDVGTGTGRWGVNFLNHSAKKVHGVDLSEKMLNKASEKYKNMTFSLGEADNLTEFDDNSFDIVTASNLLHGVSKQLRLKILQEMKRVSKEFVIIYDFVGRTPIIFHIIEILEQSYYLNFKKYFMDDLNKFFNYSIKYEIGAGFGLYIANNN